MHSSRSHAVKRRCNSLFFGITTVWNNYGFDVMMYHLLCNELLVYTFFLMGVYSAICSIYGIIDLSSPRTLLSSNSFTVMQGYGYKWVSFAVQLSAILAFVLYTKILLIYRRDLLRIQQLAHINVSSYALFLYNVRAKTRNEDIITRINKDLTYLKGTFAVPEEMRRLAGKEKDPRHDTVQSSMPDTTNRQRRKRWGRAGEHEAEHHIDYISSLERIRDLNVYHAKRRLAELKTQYYDQIKANPQKLVSKRSSGASCLRRFGIAKFMQRYGLLRDGTWYKNAIKREQMRVQKLEAMSSETSKGMAIVIFTLASARAAFYNHRQSYFGDRYINVKGNVIRVTKAPPPSEVDWDNVHRGRALFFVMFLCCLLLSSLLTSIVYLITTVIRAYQRILASQTTSVFMSLALSGSMYLVILLFDYMGRSLMTKIIQLERHHTTSAYETSYMLRYFIYIFINRLTPLYSRTILEYLNNIFINLFKPLNLNNSYFFKVIDFTKDWRWGKDTPGHDILIYVILATVFDNTLDVILHYLQPAAWGECHCKHRNNDTEHLIEQDDNDAADESTETVSLVTVDVRYHCGCRCEFCRVRTRDEETVRLKLEYSMLYCRMASLLTYILSFGYAQPIILPIASLYFFLQNIVGKCKLVYLSKPGKRFSTSLSSYFCNVLLTFSYLFAAITLAQGYLSSTIVSPVIALVISLPTVILFSTVFNTITICALIRACRCKRRAEKKTLHGDVNNRSYGMLSKEIEKERHFSKMPIYDPNIHGEYAYQPTIGYSEKECTKLDALLAGTISTKVDDTSFADEIADRRAPSRLKVSPTLSQAD